MALWVERDEKTGDVLICSRGDPAQGGKPAQGGGGGGRIGAVFRIRLRPDSARLLAGRILLASDAEGEAWVEAAKPAIDAASRGLEAARSAADFLAAAKRALG